MDRWIGRVALVTGASSGIGEAMARTLVCHGMKVVGCGRNVERIQELAETLKEEKGSLFPVKCDLSQEAEILSMFDGIRQQFGHVDVCINNGGMGFMAPLLTGSTEHWRAMLDVNVLAVAICTREAVKLMRERGIDDGHVIHINSLAGHTYPKNYTEGHFYMITKHAMSAMLEAHRTELRDLDSHIRVSCISPGVVTTNFSLRMRGKELTEKYLGHFRTLDAEDIANTLLYILGSPPHMQVHDVLIHPTEAK